MAALAGCCESLVPKQQITWTSNHNITDQFTHVEKEFGFFRVTYVANINWCYATTRLFVVLFLFLFFHLWENLFLFHSTGANPTAVIIIIIIILKLFFVTFILHIPTSLSRILRQTSPWSLANWTTPPWPHDTSPWRSMPYDKETP